MPGILPTDSLRHDCENATDNLKECVDHNIFDRMKTDSIIIHSTLWEIKITLKTIVKIVNGGVRKVGYQGH